MRDVFGEAPLKILAFCCFGAATIDKDGIGMVNALKGKASKKTSGVEIPSTVNTHRLERRGNGRCLSICALYVALIQRGERVRFAVAASQVPLFRDHLAWPLTEVIDRRVFFSCRRRSAHPFNEPDRSFGCQTPSGAVASRNPPGRHLHGSNNMEEKVGFCWASNPKTAPCMPTKAAQRRSCSHCNKECYQNAGRSACKPMRPRPISVWSCNQHVLTGATH